MPPESKSTILSTAHRVRDVVRKRPLLYCIALIATCVLLAAINFPYGIAEDPDGPRIVENALQFPDEGYQISRTWGFPLYDVFVYPILCYSGLFYAKLYSLTFYAFASVALFLTLRQLTARPFYSFLGAMCFVLLPVSIISGNTVMDTSQGIFFALLGLYFYVRFHARRHNFDFYLVALSLGAATSTRPDYVLLSAAIALTVLRFDRTNLRHLVLAASFWLAAALLPFLIYEQWQFSASVVKSDQMLRTLIKAVLGGVALLGIPATALITWWILKQPRNWGTLLRRLLTDNILFMVAVSLLLYSLRFVALPSELEYIYVLVPLLVLSAARLNVGRRGLAVLLVALAIPNVVQLNLFGKNSGGEFVLDPGIAPGVIAQERSARLRLSYMSYELPKLMETVARKHGFNEYSAEPSTENDTLVIIPEERLGLYQPYRRGGTYYQAFDKQEIIVYPMPYNRGWRHFVEVEDWHKLDLNDFREVKQLPND